MVWKIFLPLIGKGDSKDMARAPGMDVSHWDGFTNWYVAKNAGIKFGFFKGTDFTTITKVGFQDSKLEWNWNKSNEAGVLSGMYCWLQPKSDPKVQADFFLERYIKYPTKLPPVMDFEDKAVNSWSDMLWRAQVFLERIEEITGKKPIVYTSAGYMSSFDRIKSGFLSKYDLWLAQYTDDANPFQIPYPWTNWKFWQYTAYADAKTYGSQKTVIDLNYFNGNADELQKYVDDYNGTVTPVPIPVPIPTPAEKMRFKVLKNMNVRSGAGINYIDVGDLQAGAEIEVLNFNGSDVWVEFEKDRWVAYKYAGVTYLEKLS